MSIHDLFILLFFESMATQCVALPLYYGAAGENGLRVDNAFCLRGLPGNSLAVRTAELLSIGGVARRERRRSVLPAQPGYWVLDTGRWAPPLRRRRGQEPEPRLTLWSGHSGAQSRVSGTQ